VTTSTGSGERKSPLERFLGLFADVHRGEAPTVLLLMLNVFLLLTTYYIIKPVREALILEGGGAELKSYSSAGQSLLLLAIIPFYGFISSRLPRRTLINSVTVFFAACLVAFYFIARMDFAPIAILGTEASPVSVAFFLWVGIFNVMIIAQFWSFANDVYTEKQGKRLFAIVGFGASIGAVLGSKIASVLIEPIGVYQLLLVAGALLVLSLLLTNVVDSRETRRSAGEAAKPVEPLPPGNPFALVLRHRYLLLIAFLILFLNWVNTTGEYILGRTVAQTAEAAVAAGTAGGLSVGEFIGKFYADFFTVVNVVGVLIQLFLVSRILKYLGVRVALLILPVIAFGGYLILALYPLLTVVRWAKTAENATDYSLQNTLRGVLFLPTTREQKYKAKQAIDTIFVRAGDVLSALLVYVGTTFLAFGTKSFAAVNLALVVVWLVLAVFIGREYHRLAAASDRKAAAAEARRA
jgi:AAA family ATP:ADP antiporter